MAKRISIKSEFETLEDKVAFEDDLIGLVEPHKHIWDIKHVDYKNKSKKQNTFTTIGDTLHKPANVCMKIWESLRSQYLAARRKLPTGTGSEEAEEARPTFRHFDSMSFVSGINAKAKTLTNVNTADDDDEELLDIGYGNVFAEPVDEPSPGSTVVGTIMVSTTTNSPTEPPKPRSHAKFGGKRRLEPVEEEMMKFVKEGVQQKDDQFDRFGKTVAAKLRRIHEKDAKEESRCEFRIHEVLCNTELDVL